MIDPDTRNRLRVIEKLAETQGRDLFEDLDRGKLLVTATRHNEIARAVLAVAIMQLEEIHTQAIVDIDGGTNSAADAHRGAVEYLKLIARQYEERS